MSSEHTTFSYIIIIINRIMFPILSPLPFLFSIHYSPLPPQQTDADRFGFYGHRHVCCNEVPYRVLLNCLLLNFSTFKIPFNPVFFEFASSSFRMPAAIQMPGPPFFHPTLLGVVTFPFSYFFPGLLELSDSLILKYVTRYYVLFVSQILYFLKFFFQLNLIN